MLSHGAIPQELIDQVIDELGNVYRDPNGHKRPDDRIDASKALRACALTSKNWTGRSRAHLFREVKIRADEEGQFPVPSQSLMPYVEKLEIQLRFQRCRLFPAPDLLTPFHTAPIAHLGIEVGSLTTDGVRVSLMRCIVALSATLRTVSLHACLLSLRLFSDILSAHTDLERLYLHSCAFSPADSVLPTIPRPGMRLGPSDLELCIFSDSGSDHDTTMAAVARLPNQLSRLDFDHFLSGPSATQATSALIGANAESLSSLRVQIITCALSVPKIKRTSLIVTGPYSGAVPAAG